MCERGANQLRQRIHELSLTRWKYGDAQALVRHDGDSGKDALNGHAGFGGCRAGAERALDDLVHLLLLLRERFLKRPRFAHVVALVAVAFPSIVTHFFGLSPTRP